MDDPPLEMEPLQGVTHFVQTTEVSDEAVAMEFAKRLLTHPVAEDCPVDECSFCAVRDCPASEPLHYHHDGCPVCSVLWIPAVSERP